jgi:hypothetical protein
LHRYEASLRNLGAVKEWRAREYQAGRPSGLNDYYRAHAHAVCPHCRGIGLAMNENGMGYKAVGWDGERHLFEECAFCGGSGKPQPAQHSQT